MSEQNRAATRVRRGRVLAVMAVCVIALAVGAMARLQRQTVTEAFDDTRAAQQMLIAMLDQETGFRGFMQTQRETFLEPYRRGVLNFDEAVSDIRRTADGPVLQRVDRQVRVAREWQALVEEAIAELRVDSDAPLSVGRILTRKEIFDRFRQRNAEVQAEVGRQIDHELRRAETVSSGVVFGLSFLFGAIGYFSIEREAIRIRRRTGREQRYRSSQAEFSQTMQVMRDEREAYELVARHLERSIPGAAVAVLNRNNSDNGIVAATGVSQSSGLDEQLMDAAPDSCLAIRLGRSYTAGRGNAPLLSCQLCAAGSEVACVPSLISGEVIGAVLVQHERPLQPEESERITDTVVQSSPVLANLRNLAIAETRAATDALTGLPNARSCQDTLKRMVAQAGRTVSPLSAVMLDLDHFKQVNDRYGHGAGDDVLAATGAVLRAMLRVSDFAGRSGGEEFLMLLPDTDGRGALELAKRVSHAIAQIAVPRVDRAITASLGVATYPYDAGDADSLVRQADRALYAAKAAGRDRVELAGSSRPIDAVTSDPGAEADAAR